MKTWLKKISFLIILLGCPAIFFAQTIAGNLNFERFSVKNGLPGNNVKTLFQDSRGFVWIGTDAGLSRYDGSSFKNYTTLGKNGLTDLQINCIAEDKEGNIWIGTESGLNKLDPFTEKIVHYYEGTGPGTIPYRWCNYLYVDKQKNLWLSSEKGVALFDNNKNSFTNFPVKVFGNDERINKFITNILEDSKGRLWLTTSFGIKLFDRKTNTYKSYHFKERATKTAENIVYSLFEDHSGTIWAGTFYGGLLQYNPATDVFEKTTSIDLELDKFLFNDIKEISIRNRYYLLAACEEGIVCINITMKDSNGMLKNIPFGKAAVSQSGSHITKLLVDKQKNLWAGESDGFFKMSAADFALQWINLSDKPLALPFIYHIIPDIKNPESIFYLTTVRGWWKYDAVAEKITPFSLPPEGVVKLCGINRWYADDKGYWFASEGGFGYYDIYNSSIKNLSFIPSGLTGQETTGIIIKDNTGRYWVTMRRSGIFVFDPLTKKATALFSDKNTADNTFGYAITDLKLGPDGNIYFCSANKLYRINPVDLSYKTFTAPVPEDKIDNSKIAPLKILFTAGGRIIISSQLKVYEFKNEKLLQVYPTRGFSDFSIEKMVMSADNNIWVTTSNSVYKTDTSFSSWTNMGPLLGIGDEAIPPFEIYTAKTGEILFTGDGRIGILKESLLPPSIEPPAVIISRVKYGDEEKFLVAENKVLVKSSYKDAIEIQVSPVNFSDANKVFYKLNGWDNEWKELNGTSVVRYEQLPAGTYTFKARSVTASGQQGKETEFVFTITPPFYQTWWFITLSILVLSVILFMIYRYRLQKALEMERLRTRIATDLHDDIGATLSSISMYSEAVKNQVKEKMPQLENVLDKMGENSRDMVTSMSDIVWAINPDNDDGAKLIKRMEAYAADICAVKNIRLHFNADEKLNTVLLPLEHRKNIYLIFKEAVNNAAKYSSAENVWVQLGIKGKDISLSVKDDGKGFDEQTVRKGNGLKNFETRSKELKGNIVVDSAAGKGTSVSLNCSL